MSIGVFETAINSHGEKPIKIVLEMIDNEKTALTKSGSLYHTNDSYACTFLDTTEKYSGTPFLLNLKDVEWLFDHRDENPV